jgi:large subunit ribosomal protein L17
MSVRSSWTKRHDRVEKLFNVIGPKFKTRNGGYVQVYKLGHRRGDNAEVTLVKWVD